MTRMKQPSPSPLQDLEVLRREYEAKLTMNSDPYEQRVLRFMLHNIDEQVRCLAKTA